MGVKREITSVLKNYLKNAEFQEHLNKNDIQGCCYKIINDFKYHPGHVISYYIAEFTLLLLQININPLEYLTELYNGNLAGYTKNELIIPNNIVEIHSNAIPGTIKTLRIHENVYFIGDNAFDDNVDKVIYEGSKEQGKQLTHNKRGYKSSQMVYLK